MHGRVFASKVRLGATLQSVNFDGREVEHFALTAHIGSASFRGAYGEGLAKLLVGAIFRRVAQWESTSLTWRGSAVQSRPCLLNRNARG